MQYFMVSTICAGRLTKVSSMIGWPTCLWSNPQAWPNDCGPSPRKSPRSFARPGALCEDAAPQALEDRTLNSMVTAKIPTTTPKEMLTGILNTSIKHILVPMKTRITAKP